MKERKKERREKEERNKKERRKKERRKKEERKKKERKKKERRKNEERKKKERRKKEEYANKPLVWGRRRYNGLDVGLRSRFLSDPAQFIRVNDRHDRSVAHQVVPELELALRVSL